MFNNFIEFKMSAESRLHSDLLLEKFKVKLKYNSNISNFAALKDFNPM